jgi:catechol 2,3-dioxygenase-like lactoylglutathione lyase family enzyme
MAALRGETIPILPARDITDTVVFYARMGFDELRRYEGFGAPYLILHRDDVELHFVHSPELDPRANDQACYLRLADAQAVYDEWEPIGMIGLHPISDTPWGMREFSVVDPSGNLIRIGTRLAG